MERVESDSGLDCKESTKPCENRTGVSAVQTCDLGFESGFEEPEPILRGCWEFNGCEDAPG